MARISWVEFEAPAPRRKGRKPKGGRMAQFGRPISDVTVVGWTEDDGTTTNLFDQIDESSASDTDYLKTATPPAANSVYVAKLSTVTDPGTDAGHVFRYRIGKDQVGGNSVDFTVQVRQGYTNEGTMGTLVAEWTHSNVTTLSTFSQSLTTTQAASITSYGGLVGRFLVNQTDPPSGTTFFFANAETAGSIAPWTYSISDGGGSVAPSSSNATAKNGSRSWRFDAKGIVPGGHYSQFLGTSPQANMGSSNFDTGYYSFWVMVDAGYTQPDWNMLLGWMTAVSGAPSPICHIELREWPNSNGTLQLAFNLKNAQAGNYTAPAIEGYDLVANGYYFQTASSPNGITQFPRNEWVHVCAYYSMASVAGHVKIWQDGTLVMDLNHQNFNTYGGHSATGGNAAMTNVADSMILQFGIYGGDKSDGTQRIYVDDFAVTDYQVTP